jgi:enediyne biosynthesis thioesterase
VSKTCMQTSYRPRITFQDTNVVGNVYFLTFFRWQAECRDEWLREYRPDVWDAIRSGESPLILTQWSTRFDDPFGATVGDDIEVSMEFDETDGQGGASATIARLSDKGRENIGSGSMHFLAAHQLLSQQHEMPQGPCYEFTATCPRRSDVNPLDLLAWQGKCRELFLADHAPDALRRVANRQLALQTTSASLEILELLIDEVRVEMRLQDIKCGQMSVRFDYFAQSSEREIPFAKGNQRMSSKRCSDKGIVPCPLPDDILHALESFTDSELMLQKIGNILGFNKSS